MDYAVVNTLLGHLDTAIIIYIIVQVVSVTVAVAVFIGQLSRP